MSLEERIHIRLRSVGQRYFAKTINQNAYVRAFFTVWGVALKEFRVAFRQFFMWRQPVFSLFRSIKYAFGGLFRVVLGRSVKISYAFKGEDLALLALLNPVVIHEGFYVDVGCNEPRFISNTFLLYRRGWRGICIDANENLIRKHRRIRPRDRAVCALVSNQQRELEFVEFLNKGLSSADISHIQQNQMLTIEQTSRKKMVAQTLTEILDTLNAPSAFDLLTIDVEGFDFAVLQSLDFERYQPRLIVLEADDFDVTQPQTEPIYRFLTEKGYQFRGCLLTNVYFMRG
ncbi:MAG: FkbM family methyltransferase [Cytophagales bacterium]|jgi:FkbM family methyltransferase|nr:FkbM family methyltransferase [Cytophagales bacterium]